MLNEKHASPSTVSDGTFQSVSGRAVSQKPRGVMLSSDGAARERQATRDTLDYSSAFGFMSQSDWYRYWVQS